MRADFWLLPAMDDASRPSEAPADAHPVPPRSTRELGLFVAFRPGQAVMVQGLMDPQRYRGRIIGVDPYDCFIVKLPAVPGIRRLTAPGSSLTLRLETDGELFGFSCDVIACVNKPHTLLVLSYPTATERLQLRKHKRVKCLIPCTVANEFFSSPAFVMDISRGGSRLLLDTHQKQRIVNLMTGDEIFLSLSLDSMSSLACGANVVSISEVAGGLCLGTRFTGDEPGQAEALEAFMDRLETLAASLPPNG